MPFSGFTLQLYYILLSHLYMIHVILVFLFHFPKTKATFIDILNNSENVKSDNYLGLEGVIYYYTLMCTHLPQGREV